MKKVLVGALLVLGLVIGSGFVNEVSACDDCNSVYDFAEEVIEKHIHRDKCTETHYLCSECGGFYCENLPCWCGDCNGEASDYIYEQDADREHRECQLCGGLYGVDECNIGCDCVANVVSEVSIVMSYQEFGIFEEMIWDIYVEEYCVNECNECDSYYYKECMCDSCELGNECYECLHADYEIFIADNYDYIMSIADDLLVEIYMSEANEDMNQQVLVIYEF